MRAGPRRWVRAAPLAGPALAVLLLLGLELASRLGVRLPNPAAVYLLAVLALAVLVGVLRRRMVVQTARATELAVRLEEAEARRQLEEALAVLFRRNPQPMWVYDLETLRFLEVNEAAVQRYGYSREEFLRMRILDIRPPEDVPRLLEDVQRPRPALQASGTWRHRTKDGRILHVEVTSHTLPYGGRPAVLVVAHDVTERYRTEQALQESEGLFRSLVEQSLVGVYLIQDGVFRYVNPALADIFGYPREELIERRGPKDLVHPEDWPLVDANLRRRLEGEVQALRYGFRGMRKDGQVIHVEVYGARTVYQGRPAVIGTLVDVTEQKEAEEALRALTRELEERVRLRTAELEAANRELEAFSYSVAHDLRSPLRSIDGFSQALLEDYADRLDEAGQDYLRRVRAASQRMAELIDDLLQLSRVTRAPLEAQEVDLSALVQAIVEELRQREPDRAVEVHITPGIRARADPRLMRVALENLLHNAWKFTRPRPHARIAFGAAPTPHGLACFIQDNGVGFEMRYADKLFAPFQRLHKPSEFPGSGIGLATVQRIVARHGGRVWAEAEADRGATFYFILPGLREETDAAQDHLAGGG
ncbi:MAG: PAS domain S-box protein [Armatimonadota bacterium]|nr:PAS domain S-box protein [Armatimonadota bacterium]MDR7443475.1 PAS domain S-box protein [Armatimonadota bacterium]MDR7569313.1 PAS domain S-box protein [Armatimonadota bacterium]MDR7614973.1 PAS domain S-box protein [Armatimonadota bacterium]